MKLLSSSSSTHGNNSTVAVLLEDEEDASTYDVSSDEAMMQYKNASPRRAVAAATTKKRNKQAMMMTQQGSALRTSSNRVLQKSFSKTKVSFSEDDDEKAGKKSSSVSSSYTTQKGKRNSNNNNSKIAAAATVQKRNKGKESSSSRSSNNNKEETISPPSRKWGNLGRRLSWFGNSHNNGSDSLNNNHKRRNGSCKKYGYGTLLGEEDDLLDDDARAAAAAASKKDPVMTIFESRNTQRVRFTLEGDYVPTRRAMTAATTTSSTSTTANAAVKAVDTSLSADNGGGERDGVAEEKSGNEKHAGGVGGGANLKQFMSRTLFGSSKTSASTKQLIEEEMKGEVKVLGGDGSLIWESARTLSDGPEVVHTHNSKASQAELLLSFTEDPKARAAVTKLLGKARRAEHIHFRYEYAVKCYVKAINILKKAKYPDDHPTVVKTVTLMNNAHHVLYSYHNSANIVKMGIKNEDAGELIKALKMYTIAYRIRRDNLSRSHPSLVVLLNMLGSIQIKRGELKEAMQIYELALNDSPIVFTSAADRDEEMEPPVENLLARSVTFREMGTIYEMWGNIDEALRFYHQSLECVAEWRETVRGSSSSSSLDLSPSKRRSSSLSMIGNNEDDSSRTSSSRSSDHPNKCSIDNIRPISFVTDGTDASSTGLEHGEMELVFDSTTERTKDGATSNSANDYEKYFPENNKSARSSNNKSGKSSSSSSNKNNAEDGSHADMDLALTLHQIAQLYRTHGKYSKALDAFEVALRGMKKALGKHHPNVAAVLGNIGNLQKEMGDLDAAYQTYQEVLGIESYRLGLSHPDVAITLHNIATIDAARGNFEHALELYRKVIGLQKKLFGEDNLSVAVTAACMGDVYEKIGELENSKDSFDVAVRIKSAVLGRHSLDVGRLLHKLGKLSFLTKDYLEAESYFHRSILIYRLNKLSEDHQWFVDVKRDNADVDAAIVTGTQDTCEI